MWAYLVIAVTGLALLSYIIKKNELNLRVRSLSLNITHVADHRGRSKLESIPGLLERGCVRPLVVNARYNVEPDKSWMLHHPRLRLTQCSLNTVVVYPGREIESSGIVGEKSGYQVRRSSKGIANLVALVFYGLPEFRALPSLFRQCNDVSAQLGANGRRMTDVFEGESDGYRGASITELEGRDGSGLGGYPRPIGRFQRLTSNISSRLSRISALNGLSGLNEIENPNSEEKQQGYTFDDESLIFAFVVVAVGCLVFVYKLWWNISFNPPANLDITRYAAMVIGALAAAFVATCAAVWRIMLAHGSW